LEPSELQALVKGVRIVEQALGDGRKISCASEANTATVARRSLVAARDIHAGTILTQDLIAIKRPGTGLPSVMLPYVIGRVTRGNITAGTLLSMEMLQ
jgi:sialic acid synthase SpsE